MRPVQVRFASQRDLPGICRVEDDSFSEPYPRDLIAKLLRDYPDHFFVAESMPGAIVGYCVASEDANSAHLVSIGVLLEYRRRGVGTALLQKLLASLNPRVKELWLEVKQSNSEAVMLYKELGFKQVDFIENYYEDGSTALKMVLSRKDEHTVRSGGKVK